MARTRLEWAQWIAAKGINTFIVTPQSKRPLEGQSWYLRQTTEPDTLEQWFEQTPDCNYGVHLGAEYVVIDLDLKPGTNGVHEFEKICAENDIDDFRLELDTLMVRTPSGGYHLYFKSPFPCANKNHFPDGIDVRGVVGYVVGPGSEDSRGEWAVVDPDAEIMELPDWLTEYAVEPGYKDPNHDVPLIELDLDENIQHAVEWLEDRKPATEGANGDDWTYETCQYLRDFGLSETKALEVLNLDWNKRCAPPWGLDELEAKIRNAYEYGQNRPGEKAPTYKVQRIFLAHGRGAVPLLTEEQKAELFHPRQHLRMVVNNDDDSEIPEDVEDDEIDPVTGDVAQSAEFPWANAREFMNKEAVREYVVYNWLLAHGITHLIAKRGTGKSTIALNMAMHIACDMDWGGQPTQKDWKVIYICGEDDVGMRLNMRAWVDHYGECPADDRFLVAEDIIKLNDQTRLKMRLREMIAWADGAPVVVILDTWQRATAGWGKSDQEAMEEAIERAEWVASHLKGPMISCVHPPKDGRMTVVGSGVQEDTSAGIYHLEETMGGVRLKIERIKGPGRGNYMDFTLDPIELEGKDAFNKPLQGLIVSKTGGSETQNSVEAMDRLERELRGWADAIWGCNRLPDLTDSPYDKLPSLNVSNISELLAQIVQDAIEENNFDSTGFVAEYLEDLKVIHNGLARLTKHTIKKRLDELFTDAKTPPSVITKDGKYRMFFRLKNPNAKSKSKNPRKVFDFEPLTP